MKTTKYFIYSAFVSSAVLLTACAGSTDPSEAYKGETGSQIYHAGEEALRDKNYGEAIKRFEALDVQYPYEKNTETAQLHIIYAYYMNSDYVAAEAASDRFIHAHPTNAHVDYAYLMRGLANYYQNMGVFERLFTVDFSTRDLSQLKKSFNDFAEIVKQFPNSHYAPAAHQYMIYLRNVLANHQLEVAQYYYSHQAYVAAANRASLVVQYYEGAPAIPQALLMMAKSYHQLHQKQLEDQAIQVLAYNFPHSKYLAEAQSDEVTKSSVMEVPVQRLSPLPKPVAVKPPVAKRRLEETSFNVPSSNGVRGAAPVQRQVVSSAASPQSNDDSQLSIPQGNGARGSKPVTLEKMLNTDPTDAGFFTLHRKPVRQTAVERQQVASAAPRQTPMPSTTSDQPVTVVQAPVVSYKHAYSGNGAR